VIDQGRSSELPNEEAFTARTKARRPSGKAREIREEKKEIVLVLAE